MISGSDRTAHWSRFFLFMKRVKGGEEQVILMTRERAREIVARAIVDWFLKGAKGDVGEVAECIVKRMGFK